MGEDLLPVKGEMKSLTTLWSVLANEFASECHTSASHDIKTVMSRVEHEGISFLTISLPAFGKDFEFCLDQGRVSDDLFAGFSRMGGLPRFLGGFLRNVFDTQGVLKESTELVVDSISAVRQLCAVFGKIEMSCSNARISRAISSYVSADEEAGRWDDDPANERILLDLSRIAQLLFRDVFSVLDRDIYDGNITPRHGPGAVADRLRGNAKYDLNYWPARLESLFPYLEWGIPSLRYADPLDPHYRGGCVSSPEPGDEMPSRVITVPKTLKTPRVIAAEPAALQFVQQGISRRLVELLESDIHPFASMVGFSDQTANQKLARLGSLTGSLATLDMSEASDRVSLKQVMSLVTNFPWLGEALKVTRSTSALLPSGEVIPLRKFASMGSALCFPMEAVCFLTAVFLGIERKLVREGSRETLTRKQILSFAGQVRVYGDDIIVPVDCVSDVADVFRQLGWKLNVNKSFWTGKFRESCGGDFYSGRDVTPVRLKKEFPTSRRAVSSVEGLVAFRNGLYLRGLWKTARWVDSQLESLLGYYPPVGPNSSILGRLSYLQGYSERIDVRLHRPLVRGYVVRPKIPVSIASEIGSLMKCLLVSSEDPLHLERFGRPSVVDMKLKWMTPY